MSSSQPPPAVGKLGVLVAKVNQVGTSVVYPLEQRRLFLIFACCFLFSQFSLLKAWLEQDDDRVGTWAFVPSGYRDEHQEEAAGPRRGDDVAD